MPYIAHFKQEKCGKKCQRRILQQSDDVHSSSMVVRVGTKIDSNGINYNEVEGDMVVGADGNDDDEKNDEEEKETIKTTTTNNKRLFTSTTTMVSSSLLTAPINLYDSVKRRRIAASITEPSSIAPKSSLYDSVKSRRRGTCKQKRDDKNPIEKKVVKKAKTMMTIEQYYNNNNNNNNNVILNL